MIRLIADFDSLLHLKITYDTFGKKLHITIHIKKNKIFYNVQIDIEDKNI